MTKSAPTAERRPTELQTEAPAGAPPAPHPDRAPDWRPQTLMVRGGLNRSEFGETSEALFLTSGYIYDRAEDAEAAFKGENDRFIYSRYGNPTVGMFEERIRLLEGAEAVRSTASGMSAVFASLMAQLRAGSRVVASRALFGSIYFIIGEILPRFGIETEFVDGGDLDGWAEALSRPADCVLLETPSNPGLQVIDIAAVAELAHAAGARLIVDNVFATPILQKPLELGADIVVYSATKHIDGQGRALGGVILGSSEFCDGDLMTFLRHTGPALSPFNAWTLLKGLETLEVRVDRQVANARETARFLEDHPKVGRVLHPDLPSHPQHELARRQMRGGGTVIAFDVAGGKEAAFRFANALRLVDISNNLGDSKSLLTHPATTTHQRLSPEERARLGITDEMVRLSVGLEDLEDLKSDLNDALMMC
jgi:O-succinylhomoserine sulfhydrylase